MAKLRKLHFLLPLSGLLPRISEAALTGRYVSTTRIWHDQLNVLVQKALGRV